MIDSGTTSAIVECCSLLHLFNECQSALQLVVASVCVGFLLCSWQKHPQVGAMWSCLRHVARYRPLAGLWENVIGLTKAKQGELSPLEVVYKEMESMQYCCTHIVLNLSAFHTITRERSPA